MHAGSDLPGLPAPARRALRASASDLPPSFREQGCLCHSWPSPLLRVTSSQMRHLLCALGSRTGSPPCSDRKSMPRLPADGGSGPLWGHRQIWTHFLHPPFFLWLALSWVTFSGLLFLTVVPSMLCLPLQVTYLPFPLPSIEVCCCFQLEAL